MFAANDIRARRERKMLAWAHHAGAAWQRAKRIPPLSPILRRLDPPKPMSHKAIRDTVLTAFKAMGAEIVRRKKGS